MHTQSENMRARACNDSYLPLSCTNKPTAIPGPRSCRDCPLSGDVFGFFFQEIHRMNVSFQR